MKQSTSLETGDWYARYYREKGAQRNDILNNPEVLFQVFASDAAFIRALATTKPDLPVASVLDVGCGNGASLLNFLRIGFRPQNLHGIDLQEERIADAKIRLPGCHFLVADASRMPHQAGSFAIVYESTMFIQLTDETLAAGIAHEMLRVCKLGGYVVLSDWRYGKPFNSNYLAFNRARITRLFQVGAGTRWVKQFRGSLVPPIGRPLSRFLSPVYFLAQALLPFASGQVVTVLQKIP